MEARCPECPEGVGESVERTVTDSGLAVVFRCDSCDDVWTITF
jgi:uncharacterized Zn finger protein